MPVVIAKQEFQGNPQEQELSFPVGAIIEVTPEKKVVWTWRDFTNFGNSTPVVAALPDKK